ncbi:histone-lysine N-methyltransferase SETMAR [Plakobranchus ocellatus]|uniref:Histone-lysine N-methyltransferase SETMAR n=1 Tax=Plakobranchus ocellatus TaxID=259542 RepID=A0AAV4DP16_9GAST|nr:histone-lysine N-methyltransferase SETMAR [Plakobranchus ocellatus]
MLTFLRMYKGSSESNRKMIITFDLVNTLNSGKQHIVGKFIVHLVRKFSTTSVNALLNSIDLKMVPPIAVWSKLEIRAVVRFLFAKGTKYSVINREIVENYGEHAMSMTQVYQWCSWFKELIKVDQRVKLKQISLKLDIPKMNVYEIVHDKLGYRKVSARWVPKMLSDEHKHQRVEISQILLHRCQQEGDETIDVEPGGDHRARNKLLEYLITGDETWLHLSTLETKHDSMTWKHPSSPVTRKFKVQQLATSVMATIFWDSCGMILLNILPKGESSMLIDIVKHLTG